MIWNYRVVRTEEEEYDSYRLYEVYYDDEGKIEGMTKDSTQPSGESVEELQNDLEYMMEAFGNPVLDMKELEKHFEETPPWEEIVAGMEAIRTKKSDKGTRVQVNNSLVKPHAWVILKINHEGKTLYKVLAGWNGGYLDSDSWRMNSGIVAVDKQAYLYGFYGSSGSAYWCHQGAYRLTPATSDIYNKLKKQFGDAVELMPEDTDWMAVQW